MREGEPSSDSGNPSGDELVNVIRESIVEILPPSILNHVFLMENSSVPNTGVIVGDVIDNKGTHLLMPLAVIAPSGKFFLCLREFEYH